MAMEDAAKIRLAEQASAPGGGQHITGLNTGDGSRAVRLDLRDTQTMITI